VFNGVKNFYFLQALFSTAALFLTYIVQQLYIYFTKYYLTESRNYFVIFY